MFCSEVCRDRSFERYHKYECPVMDQLLKSGTIHMPLRQLFIAMSCFGGEIEKLEMFVNEHEDTNFNIFEFDMKLHDINTDKNLLLALRSLIKSSIIFELDDHKKIMENHPQLKENFHKHQKFIESFLQRQCQISDLNFHGIFSGIAKKQDDSSTNFSSMTMAIGTGSLLFGSLSNHSCANNVFRVYVEGHVVYTVCRPIQKGSQIFDCYK